MVLSDTSQVTGQCGQGGVRPAGCVSELQFSFPFLLCARGRARYPVCAGAPSCVQQRIVLALPLQDWLQPGMWEEGLMPRPRLSLLLSLFITCPRWCGASGAMWAAIRRQRKSGWRLACVTYPCCLTLALPPATMVPCDSKPQLACSWMGVGTRPPSCLLKDSAVTARQWEGSQ